jgi:O-antigen ligase/tetratricopeptide (TPR) repeat protein
VTRILEVITLIGIYGGLLMPLVVAPIVTFPFIFSKMLYFQILVGLTFPAWVTLASRDARYRPRASLLLWAVLAWFAAMGLATAFAESHWRSFFGTQERMTGLFSLLHFLAWYVMAASMLRSSRDWRRLLEFQIGVGFIAACATWLLPLYPNWFGSTEVAAGSRLSGLFGNPIFAASYQVFNAFFILFLFQDASWKRRCWYGLALGAGLISIVLAGSRGPLLGLVAGLGAAGLTLALTSAHRRFVISLAIGVAALGTTYVLMLVFVVHAPSLESFWAAHFNLRHLFDFQIDISRIRLWTAAWAGFLARPILGWGPVGFEAIFDALYRPEFHTLGIEDQSHNELLGVLSETGLVGLAAFLSMWAAYFWTVVRAMRKEALVPIGAAALIGAGAGHFIQNLFAFDTPGTYASTFLALATTTAIISSTQTAPSIQRGWAVKLGRWFPFGAVPALMVAVVIVGSVMPGVASAYATKAATVGRANPDKMLALMTRSQRLACPYRDDQLAIITQFLLRLTNANRFEGWSQRENALVLAQKIADQHFANLKAHIRLRRIYAKMLAEIGKREHDTRLLQKAESLYEQNLSDSPRRQQHLMDYAWFLAETGRSSEAEVQFRKAVALDPTVGEPQWALGQFTRDYLKSPQESARLMAQSYDPKSIDTFWPRNSHEWRLLAQACAQAGETEKLRGLVKPVRDFPKYDSPTEALVGIAGYMELAGLVAERDQVLALARERNPKAARLVDPVLAGTAKLLVPRVRHASKSQESSISQPQSG